MNPGPSLRTNDFLPPSIVSILKKAGIETMPQLATLAEQKYGLIGLTAIDGIGLARYDRILTAVKAWRKKTDPR